MMLRQKGNRKNMIDAKAKWIWLKNGSSPDSYGEFYTELLYEGGETEILLSADSDYTLFINGQFVNSDQYKDFPYCKVYDRFEITPYLVQGKNHVAILVWYYGLPNSSYYPGEAGLWFEIRNGGKCIAWSGEHTQSRLSSSYRNGLQKAITAQLGLSFEYHAEREDNWKTGELNGFSESIPDHRETPAILRPIKKTEVGECAQSVLIRSDENTYLYDLGREEVGYLTLRVCSEASQKLNIAWGEHIIDGGVRQRIRSKDFSVDVIIPSGTTEYTNYFRRLGLRYLELHAEAPLLIDYASVRPCFYPLEYVQTDFHDSLLDQIYQVSVRTLALCMHDHYEDCPWREQALYAMDGRNQSLCSYYAFREFTFSRACLWLMSKDNRKDGLLSICTPDSNDLTIPSFSLHYFTEIYEYTVYSGDLTLAREVMPKLTSLIQVFLSHMKNGLVPVFSGKCHWNYYEWSEDLSGELGRLDAPEPDAPLNCLLSIALDRLQRLCDLLEIDADYKTIAQQVNQRIFEEF